MDLRQRLAARAFAVVPGAGYNAYRRQAEEREAGMLYYEVALDRDPLPQVLADRVLPELARYLRVKRIDPAQPHDVVIAVFVGDACYLLRGERFVALFCELEGLNRDALHFRIQRWLADDP